MGSFIDSNQGTDQEANVRAVLVAGFRKRSEPYYQDVDGHRYRVRQLYYATCDIKAGTKYLDKYSVKGRDQSESGELGWAQRNGASHDVFVLLRQAYTDVGVDAARDKLRERGFLDIE
jgi:hypothetical protein